MITFFKVTQDIDCCKARFVTWQEMTALDWVAVFKFAGLKYTSVEIYEGVIIGPRDIFKGLKAIEDVLIIPPKFETDAEFINRRFGEEF